MQTHSKFRVVHLRWATLALIASLGIFEIIQGPKNRKPSIRVRRGQARQMGGINDEHGVELETDRPRLNIAHSG